MAIFINFKRCSFSFHATEKTQSQGRNKIGTNLLPYFLIHLKFFTFMVKFSKRQK